MWSASVTNMVRGLIPETLKYQYRQNIQKLPAKNQCQVPYSSFCIYKIVMSGKMTSATICGSSYFTGLTDS
jgi:hypothetical protein